MRKLKKTLAMMSLLSPLSVHALGVGEIKLHSVLNQNLKADIPLISSRTESVSDIRVRLASPEAFARAGVERQFYLSTLRFRPVLQPNGEIVIKVTSLDAVREPFLDFLIEVDWPQGHIIREFTLLLDPPVTYRKKTVEVINVPTAVSAKASVQPSNLPSPAEPYRQVPVVAPSVRTSKSSLALGDEYGPVARNDTLWKIVNSVEIDDSISKEQLLISIFQNNQHAFFKKNINALKAGQTITIPDRDTVQGLSKSTAISEYKRQNNVWYGRVSDEPPKKADASNLAAAGEEVRTQLKLMTPSDVKTLAAGEESEGALAGDGKSKADLAMEIATSAAEENEELKSRLSHLEEQLAEMQRLIAFKDAELAAIQARNATRESSELKPGSAGTASVETIDEQQPEISQKPAEPVKRASKKPVTKSQSKRAVTAPTQDDLISDILSEPFYLTAGGAGMALLALLAFLIMRKRGTDYGAERESILTVPDVAPKESRFDSNQKDSREFDSAAESSFLSEFTPSDFDSLKSETDEVDPISEADVYLAYGRYQQAEDLIRQAINDDPDRDECKLKLLEIFYAKENRDGFEAYAAALSQEKLDDSEFWSKVAEMGQELCPESELFSTTRSAATSSVGIAKFGTDDLEETEEISVDITADDSNESGREADYFPNKAETISEVTDESESSSSFKESDGAEPVAEAQNTTGESSVEPLEFNASSWPSLDDNADQENEIEVESSNDEAANILEFETDDSIKKTGGQTEDDDEIPLDFPEQNFEPEQSDDSYSGLTDRDEIETKLDLAKAYVDMDDTEAAKEILEEIVKKGTDAQRSEATDLMEKLEVNG